MKYLNNLLALLGIFISLNVTAQTLEQKNIIVNLINYNYESLDIIESKNVDKNTKKALDNLSMSYISFESKINLLSNNKTNTQLDTLFMRSLKDSQLLLQKISHDSTSVNENAFLIQSLSNDIKIKISAASAGLASSFNSKIKVKIKTIKNNANEDGYDVSCDYIWDFSTPIHRFFSNNPTNNAIIEVSPGMYIFYIRMKGIIVQKRDVKINADNNEIIFNL
jgi:hypothetical protein